MDSIGNHIANCYYEKNIKNGGQSINSMSSDNQKKNFIISKYSKKLYTPPGEPEPIKLLYQCKQNGVPFNPSYAQSGSVKDILNKQKSPPK